MECLQIRGAGFDIGSESNYRKALFPKYLLLQCVNQYLENIKDNKSVVRKKNTHSLPSVEYTIWVAPLKIHFYLFSNKTITHIPIVTIFIITVNYFILLIHFELSQFNLVTITHLLVLVEYSHPACIVAVQKLANIENDKLILLKCLFQWFITTCLWYIYTIRDNKILNSLFTWPALKA